MDDKENLGVDLWAPDRVIGSFLSNELCAGGS